VSYLDLSRYNTVSRKKQACLTAIIFETNGSIRFSFSPMKTCFSTNIHDITEVIGNQLSPIRSRSNKNVSEIQI